MATSSHLDHLHAIALRLRGATMDMGFWVLSQGERCYVALAASRNDLLLADSYTIPAALARLDDDWLPELIRRHRHAAVPRHEDATG
jgi:hypothetical protein